jgi:hypothetical protein
MSKKTESVDPSPPAPQYPTFMSPCKRGSDPSTSGQSCNGREVLRISAPGSRVVTLRCKKCNHSWSISVGGFSEE